MVGFATGVGKVTINTAIRQIARQCGREALDGIMAAEATEDVLTRNPLKELPKNAQVALGE